MLKKTTRIAISLALLLYSAGIQQAHTLSVFPTGRDIAGIQTYTPSTGVDSLNNSTQPSPLPGVRDAPPAEKTVGTISKPGSNPEGRNGKSADTSRNKSAANPRVIKAKRDDRRLTPVKVNPSFSGMETLKRNLKREYYNRTGRELIIRSAFRTPAGQARAILKNLRTYGVQYVIRSYRRKAAIRDIVRAYKSNRRRPRRALIAMTNVIEAQLGRGVFVSRHMLGRAFDVRSRGRNGARLAILREVAQNMGGRVVVERNHYHVEL